MHGLPQTGVPCQQGQTGWVLNLQAVESQNRWRRPGATSRPACQRTPPVAPKMPGDPLRLGQRALEGVHESTRTRCTPALGLGGEVRKTPAKGAQRDRTTVISGTASASWEMQWHEDGRRNEGALPWPRFASATVALFSPSFGAFESALVFAYINSPVCTKACHQKPSSRSCRRFIAPSQQPASLKD